jgi:hypothetical protein
VESPAAGQRAEAVGDVQPSNGLPAVAGLARVVDVVGEGLEVAPLGISPPGKAGARATLLFGSGLLLFVRPTLQGDLTQPVAQWPRGPLFTYGT